jgi:hypothetical protein
MRNPLEILPDDGEDVDASVVQMPTVAEWREIYREIVTLLGGVFEEHDFQVAMAQIELFSYHKKLN